MFWEIIFKQFIKSKKPIANWIHKLFFTCKFYDANKMTAGAGFQALDFSGRVF